MAEHIDTSELLNQIITDRRYLSATDRDGKTVDLTVRSLTPSERLYAEFLYKKALSIAKQQKLLSQKQYMSDAILKGLWTRDKEKLIDIYENELLQLEKQRSFYSSSANKGKSLKFSNDIIKTRKKLIEIQEERDSYCTNSFENHATHTRSNFIVGRMVMNLDGTQRWNTHEDFLNETDLTIVRSILGAIGSLIVVVESDIRKVARAPAWTIMWGSSKKTGDPLFGKPSTDYTIEQSLLCYWAMMYDSVYESPDKPSDKIIDDDEKLDKWFEDQRKDKKKKNNASRSPTSKHPEQFIMAKNDEEADEIWELNSEWTLARLRKEAEIIEQAGSISEYKLRRDVIKKNLALNNSSTFAKARREIARPKGFT